MLPLLFATLIAGTVFYIFVFGGFIFIWTSMIWWMWKVLHSLYFIFLDPWLELLGLKAIKRFPNLSSFKRFPNLSSFSFLPDMNREASRMASPRSRTVINSSLPAYSPSQGVEATTGNSILDRVRSCQYMSVQYL